MPNNRYLSSDTKPTNENKLDIDPSDSGSEARRILNDVIPLIHNPLDSYNLSRLILLLLSFSPDDDKYYYVSILAELQTCSHEISDIASLNYINDLDLKPRVSRIINFLYQEAQITPEDFTIELSPDICGVLVLAVYDHDSGPHIEDHNVFVLDSNLPSHLEVAYLLPLIVPSVNHKSPQLDFDKVLHQMLLDFGYTDINRQDILYVLEENLNPILASISKRCMRLEQSPDGRKAELVYSRPMNLSARSVEAESEIVTTSKRDQKTLIPKDPSILESYGYNSLPDDSTILESIELFIQIFERYFQEDNWGYVSNVEIENLIRELGLDILNFSALVAKSNQCARILIKKDKLGLGYFLIPVSDSNKFINRNDEQDRLWIAQSILELHPHLTPLSTFVCNRLELEQGIYLENMIEIEENVCYASIQELADQGGNTYILSENANKNIEYTLVQLRFFNPDGSEIISTCFLIPTGIIQDLKDFQDQTKGARNTTNFLRKKIAVAWKFIQSQLELET